MFSRFATRYNALFEKAPIMTMCLTAGTLGGISDAVAQGLTIYQTNKNAMIGLDGVRLNTHPEIPSIKRVLQFVTFGFAISPFQFRWLRLLSAKFPIEKGAINVVKRVLLDQAVFAPFGTAFFFSWMVSKN